MSDVPAYLWPMVRRKPPVDGAIVDGSTPVISFGSYRDARVATLGINPSNIEFEHKGKLLTGEGRRLATLESLRADSLEALTDEHVRQVIADCDNYFNRRPYAWFTPLDNIISAGLGASYFDGSACHLDLVQWSTKSKWSALDLTTRLKFLNDGRDHLVNQLLNSDISVLVINGNSVWSALESAGFGHATQVGTLLFGKSKTKCRLLVNQFEGIQLLGWSSNLQSQHGAQDASFHTQLASWLQERTGRANGGLS